MDWDQAHKKELDRADALRKEANDIYWNYFMVCSGSVQLQYKHNAEQMILAFRVSRV